MSEKSEASVDLKSTVRTILMACDEGYAMPLATTLRSIAETNTGAGCIEVIVLTSYFSPEIRDKVVLSLPDQSVLVRWMPVELQRFQKCSTRTYISKITYARLLLSSLFPKSVGKVLYLDADILVNGNLSPLWDIDLNGAAVAAVVDTDAQAHGERLKGAEFHNQGDGWRNRSNADYFNAGVLLIDLEQWRQRQISEKALDYMSENPDTPLADQDALNVACAGRWKKLDPGWNYQTHPSTGYEPMVPEQRPPIVHFAGRFKPWDASSLSVDADFYDGWRSRTRFARTPLEKVYDGIRKSSARLRSRLRKFETLRTVYRSLTDSRAEIAGAGIKL